MERIVITPQEAAEMAATSPNNIYPLLDAGVIPATRMFGGNWKIPRQDFINWLSATAQSEAEERRNKCQK